MRRWFPLLLLVPGALLAWLLWPTGDALDAPAVSGPGSAAATPAATEADGPAEIESPGIAAPAPAPPAFENAREAQAPEAAQLALDAERTKDHTRVHGRLQIPGDTPADERAVVLAMDADHPTGAVYGNGTWPTVEDPNTGERVPFLAEAIAQATVQGDGSFELRVPPEHDQLWLYVAGSYLYSSESTPWSRAGEAAPTLEARLGARVSGIVLPPEDEGLESLADLEVLLNTDVIQANIRGLGGLPQVDRSVDLDEAGRFEFFAVPAQAPLEIETESDHWAAYVQKEIDLAPGTHKTFEIQLLRGVTIAGRVLDEDGRGIEGTEVDAAGIPFFGFPSEDLRETHTDAQGRFRLEGVRPGKIWIVAQAEGYLERMSSPFETEDGGEYLDQDVVLSSGSRMEGLVVFPDGSPASSAYVQAVRNTTAIGGLPQSEDDLYGTNGDDHTDEEGRFAISPINAGSFKVTATVTVVEEGDQEAGTWTASLAEVLGSDQDVLLTLAPPVRLTGRVLTADGSPVPSFRIDATLPGAQFFLPPEDTKGENYEDEEGRFVLGGLRDGRWEVVARAEGFATPEPVEIDLPSDEELEIVLVPPVSVSGSVTDPSGNPVAGARVTPELDMVAMLRVMVGGDDPMETETDAAGNFLLEGLRPGTGSVVANHDAWAESEPVGFELTSGESFTDARLVLREGAVITGEVYDDQGERAPGKQIILQFPDGSNQTIERSDDEGEFRFERVKPGSYQVLSMGNTGPSEDDEGGFGSLFEGLTFSMVDVADRDEKHVVLGAPPENPVVVHGTVRHGGDPVSGALVSFISKEAESLDALKMDMLESDGRYEVKLDAEGDYLVTVQADVGMGLQQSLEFSRTVAGEESVQMDFELPVGGIRGRVFDAEGEALAGARVTLNTGGGVAFGTFLGGNYAETVTNGEGEYSLLYLDAGDYLVAAGGAALGGLFGDNAPGGRQVRRVSIAENQLLTGQDFHLETPGTIRGVVRDTNGTPISGASVFVRDAAGLPLERFSINATDASGRFSYGGVAPGRYTVSARSEDLASLESAAISVAASQEAEVELSLQAGTRLLISLTDRSGSNVPAIISVVDEAGREHNGLMSMADLQQLLAGLGSGSEQRVGPLPAGKYTVRAVTLDGRSTKKPVTLGGQAERKLRLRLGD